MPCRFAAVGVATVERRAPIAAKLGSTLAQTSLPWCLKNPQVSRVITGTGPRIQIKENMKTLDVAGKLAPDVMAGIAAVAAAGRHAT